MVVNIPKQYFDKISNRNLFRFYLGLIPRILIFIKYAFFRQVVRFRGGIIGDDSIVSWKLARKANKNLIIGSDCIIQSFNLDLRSKIIISDHVIINKDVSIIRVSHHIDDDTTFSSRYLSSIKNRVLLLDCNWSTYFTFSTEYCFRKCYWCIFFIGDGFSTYGCIFRKSCKIFA